MNPRLLALSISLLLPAQLLVGQQSTESKDIEASVRSCRVVQMTLAARERMRDNGDVPGDDDFTASGKACAELQTALSTTDSNKIHNAVEALRPILALLGLPPSSPREQLTALERKASGLKGTDLFYELPDLAEKAFNAGEVEKAKAYSNQLLQAAPQYPKDWNYGNAIFYGNFVLGRIALQQGKVKQAGQYLLAAGATPGSPQLDSFGPNMTLAKELLEKGESGVVLQYFALCKNFWEGGQRELAAWSATVQRGESPDFGRNLSN